MFHYQLLGGPYDGASLPPRETPLTDTQCVRLIHESGNPYFYLRDNRFAPRVCECGRCTFLVLRQATRKEMERFEIVKEVERGRA